jgi:putative CRISPR-associated protein (TIGR02619 family)
MAEPSLIISTCGTSLLTQAADAKTRGRLTELANHRECDLSSADLVFLNGAVAQARQILERAPIKNLHPICAELNALSAWYKGPPPDRCPDQHILIHSDTWQAREVAKILEAFLKKQGVSVEAYAVPGMRTSDPAAFGLSLAHLAKFLFERLAGFREKGWKVVFQLNGGFKPTQGFMQTVGMFLADEIIYVFEGSHQLLRIPRIPLDLEKSMLDEMTHHHKDYRQLARLGLVSSSLVDGLPGIFLEISGSDAAFSPWGVICWERAKRTIYAESLLPSPHPSISFSERFEQDARQRSSVELRWLNERIDDFSTFLDEGKNISRLDFKALKSKPMPPSTHEFDAWAQSPGFRVFCHKQGGRWVLDRLTPGLNH